MHGGGEPWFKHTKRLNAHPFSIHSLHCPKKQLQFFHSDAVTGQNSQHLYQQIYKQNTAALPTAQSVTKHSVNQYMSHCWTQKQTLHSPSCINRTLHSPSSLSSEYRCFIKDIARPDKPTPLLIKATEKTHYNVPI